MELISGLKKEVQSYSDYRQKIDFTNFSDKQKQILLLFLDGKTSNKQIANILNIKEKAVKDCFSLIFKKIGVKTRYELLNKYVINKMHINQEKTKADIFISSINGSLTVRQKMVLKALLETNYNLKELSDYLRLSMTTLYNDLDKIYKLLDLAREDKVLLPLRTIYKYEAFRST